MKRRRGYFKHYNDASRGETLSRLAIQKKYLAICLFWHSLELANASGHPGQGSVNINILCGHYRTKSKSIIASYHAISEVVDDFKFTLNGLIIDFVFSNYAEYQETRGQKTCKNGAKNVPIKDKRLKIKDKRLNIPPLPPKGTPATKLPQSVLDALYKKYPRKQGKQVGMKKLKSIIKTECDAKRFEQAMDRFVQVMKNEGRPSDKIPYFSTFVNSHWQDYLDEDVAENQDFSANDQSWIEEWKKE